MIGWWPGDGNANDIMGSNDGTPVNGATFAAGLIGQAFSLDGVDDSVSFGNTIGNLGTADFTADLWLRTSSGASQGVLGKRAVCAQASFWDLRTSNFRRLIPVW